MHHLAERRVREDGFHQFRLGGFQRAANDIALDQLGHLGADHVGAQPGRVGFYPTNVWSGRWRSGGVEPHPTGLRFPK